MLLKIASCEVIDLYNCESDSSQPLTKTAANFLRVESEEIKRVVESEIKKHPTALFWKAKAIVADETNSNGDYFPTDELIKAYATFIGVPFFTNHQNSDVENAKGKIVHAEWNPREKAIYVIGFVDREAYPHICRGIEEDYMSGVSMGCSVEYSLCSICHKKAASVEEYCDHVKYRKGKKFSGKAKDFITGEVKTFKDAPIFEINYGIKFIELSAVGDPACRTCRIDGVINNQEFLQKAAKVQENINMYRESAISKEASQQEVDQLNQVLSTLEQICIGLIQNRQKVETEFASDLVKILSDLQTFTDELVGAGYGQLPAGAPGQAAPVSPTGADLTAPPMAGAPAVPVSQEMPLTPPVAGSPTPSPVQPPTPPIKPIAEIINRLQKISSMFDDLHLKEPVENKQKIEEKLSNNSLQNVIRIIQSKGIDVTLASTNDTGDEIVISESDEQKLAEAVSILEDNGFNIKTSEEGEDMIRRTPETANSQRKQAMKKLTENWKEKKDLSTQFKNIIGNSNTSMQKGDSTMRLEASRTNAPEVITEKQLDSTRQGYHPRTEEAKDEITQAQLDGEKGIYGHKGTEEDVLTEKLIEEKRLDNTPEVITQKQIEPNRKNQEKDSITQDQLDAEGYRSGKEENQVTEAQLEKKTGDDKFWGRKAFSRINIKTAEEHLADVLTSVAEAAVFCGATPQQSQEVISSIVDSFNSKANLLEVVSSEDSDNGKDIYSYASSYRYFAEKGIPVPPVSKKQLKSAIVSKLHNLVASDEKIHPEVVVDVLEVLSEDEEGIKAISESIDEQLKKAEAAPQSGSSKNKVRSALKTKVQKEAKVEEKKDEPSADKRAEERKDIQKKIAKKEYTHRIVASYDEVGITKEMVAKGSDHKEAKAKISSYVKGISDTLGKKLAGITNVEVDGQKIDIRVQWDGEDEQEVNLSLPPSEEGMAPESTPPEGETEGAGLDNILAPPAEAPAPAPAVPTAATPMPAMAASETGLKKEAQFGGMTGGAMPGLPPAAQGQSTENMAATPPAEEQPVQSLTEEAPEEEEKSTIGEQMMPGSICPVCGSTNTETGRKDLPAGSFECKDCTAKYQYHVMMEVLNPQEVLGGEGEEGTVKEPEAPAMPVAASIDITKDSLVKLAEVEKQKGHICPACGMDQCKPLVRTAGHIKYVCPSCETETSKDIFVKEDDPKQLRVKVAWAINPKKVHKFAKCDGCEESVKKFAARVKVASMMKRAESSEFPMANCIERVSRKYGSNSVAHFGPCKGKPLAECVCKQLQQFGMTKVKHLNKLASVYTMEDPLDECIKDHIEKNFSRTAAESLCNKLKEKYASKEEKNAWLMAFAEDDEFNAYDLDEMSSKIEPKELPAATEELPAEDEEIGAPIDAVPENEETVTIEISKDEAEKVKAQIEEATTEVEVVAGEPELGSGSNVEVTEPIDAGKSPVADEQLTASNKGEKSMIKEAVKPTKIENIEKDVEKMPRGKATLGNEGPKNIDVKENKPEIPSGKATLGNEGKDNIDVPADLPDIPADDSKMGGEKETQKDMPAINTEIKGTVIAEVEIDDNGNIVKIAAVPTKVEHIETEVEAGIPRAKATLGKEGPQNIDVEAKKPAIPTGKATLGQEGADNIDVPVSGPDIPVDSSTIKGEKETQKDMPEIKNTIKGTIIADRKEDAIRKLAEARQKEAMKVAAQLLSDRRIKAEDFDEVVEDLSKLETQRIKSFAEKLFPKNIQKQASVESISIPIIQESKGVEIKTDKPLLEKLAGAFTIGTKKLNESLIEDGTR